MTFELFHMQNSLNDKFCLCKVKTSIHQYRYNTINYCDINKRNILHITSMCVVAVPGIVIYIVGLRQICRYSNKHNRLA